MPIGLMRLVYALTARAWRLPALVMVLSAAIGFLLIYLCEPRDAEIRRPLDYLWYFFISGTTTGYGDLSPTSMGGRIGGVLIIIAGLTAGLMLFAELTLWLAKGRTMKATGHAKLSHQRHLVVLGYNRDGLRSIIGQLRADPEYARTPVVTIFLDGELDGENPDPKLYDVVAYDETAFERACLEDARCVLVAGRSDDETVRLMLSVAGYLRRHGEPRLHMLAGLHEGGRRDEFVAALELIGSEIEPVDIDDPAVVAVAIRNPGIAAIYHNLASTLDSDADLFRIDIPADAGSWPRLDLAISLLHRGCTLLAVGESQRPNARFRLAAEPDEIVRGGQSLAVVCKDRPAIDWATLGDAQQGFREAPAGPA
jgi:voltage-gated potassium channel